jgi:hypothetical protein
MKLQNLRRQRGSPFWRGEFEGGGGREELKAAELEEANGLTFLEGSVRLCVCVGGGAGFRGVDRDRGAGLCVGTWCWVTLRESLRVTAAVRSLKLQNWRRHRGSPFWRVSVWGGGGVPGWG